MNQITSAEFNSDTVTAVTTIMSRKEKLQRWADLIRMMGDTPLALFSNLERWDQEMLDHVYCFPGESHAFGVALCDPILQDAGLVGKPAPGKPPGSASISEVTGFFELSKEELHEFSCDCGGSISNREMASRIEHIANGGTPRVNPPSRFSFREALYGRR